MSGFDRLARPYRLIEYLSFGRALERCRFLFLPLLSTTKHVLLLGDGDGRFAARLLQEAPDAKADAIDGSAAMLARLQQRCHFAADRLTIHLADLSHTLPALPTDRFDLVTTHFFLDCLSTDVVDGLVTAVKPLLTAEARWVISEFAVPQRGPMRLPAWLIVRSLYASFRLLTGLKTQRLPDYPAVLRKHGFRIQEQRSMLHGLLVAEVWRAPSNGNSIE